MSGHSKWAQIKHKKQATDAQKGRLFTKLGNAITIAAKESGGDPATNFKLRLAIDKAKSANMPSENIERAIKRGTGELAGATIQEAIYEAFGPGGVGILIQIATDNKNRTASQVKNVLEKLGGRWAGTGAVSWNFQLKGVIRIIEKDPNKKEALILKAIDAGALDIQEEGEDLVIFTAPQDLSKIKKLLEEAGAQISVFELSQEPKEHIKITDPQIISQILKLMDALDEIPEVTNIYANFDIPDDLLDKS